ncbi:bacteriochlorophyll 4-vinyl reductase [Planococcus alpniumensis]|uniref:bacteriochlorophyll 4-vinyl reductase n=1 Tax=Planococcus alpniumensis TaxID=2708345 RepID=UPI001B8CC339|nr:bacteriochlorophyll 4-vinyl reductase [Planococcus sp. MSAK28401]
MAREVQEKHIDIFYATIKTALNTPGVRIQRNDFLMKQLSKHFPKDVVDEAILKNPASAGITKKEIEKIAVSCIKYEKMKVTSLSAAAGIPGGFAMFGTVPADTAQYFAHVIRVMQKLVYLYGWEELYDSEEGFDDETMNRITLFMGVMFGVSGANAAINQIAKIAAVNVEKKIARKALTKGAIYPLVKRVAGVIGVKMTKEIFAKGIGKTIPFVSAAISGGMTYTTFSSMTSNLKKHLKDLPIADEKFYDSFNLKEKDIIDVEFEEIL